MDKDISDFDQIHDSFIANTNHAFIHEAINQLAGAIENSNPALTQFLISLAGALSGALIAFALNAWHENLKEGRNNNSIINETINLLSANLKSLINYKGQFLHAFMDEFKAIGHHAAEYHLIMPPGRHSLLAAEWQNEFLPAIEKMIDEFATDPAKQNLNGLLLSKMENIRLVDLDINKISSTAEEKPYIIQTVLDCLFYFDLMKETIRERNIIRQEAEMALSHYMWLPEPAFMKELFLLINIRETILTYTDAAIVHSLGGMHLLAQYQKERFPCRKGLMRKVFGQRYSWVRFNFPSEIIKYIPDINTYGNLGRNKMWDGIRENWYNGLNSDSSKE